MAAGTSTTAAAGTSAGTPGAPSAGTPVGAPAGTSAGIASGSGGGGLGRGSNALIEELQRLLHVQHAVKHEEPTDANGIIAGAATDAQPKQSDAAKPPDTASPNGPSSSPSSSSPVPAWRQKVAKEFGLNVDEKSTSEASQPAAEQDAEKAVASDQDKTAAAAAKDDEEEAATTTTTAAAAAAAAAGAGAAVPTVASAKDSAPNEQQHNGGLEELERPICEAWFELVRQLSSASKQSAGNQTAAAAGAGASATSAVGVAAGETNAAMRGAAAEVASALLGAARTTARRLLENHDQLLDDIDALAALSPPLAPKDQQKAAAASAAAAAAAAGTAAGGAAERVRRAFSLHCEAERESLLRSLRAMSKAATVLAEDSWWGTPGRGAHELRAALSAHASTSDGGVGGCE